MDLLENVSLTSCFQRFKWLSANEIVMGATQMYFYSAVPMALALSDYFSTSFEMIQSFLFDPLVGLETGLRNH